MVKRLQLQLLLEAVLKTSNVYFQPPATMAINYPCIVYTRSSKDTVFANNFLYANRTKYQVTIIDRDPDSVIPERMYELPMCIFDRYYTSDNLNHSVFNIYY